MFSEENEDFLESLPLNVCVQTLMQVQKERRKRKIEKKRKIRKTNKSKNKRK
jgi:hypothetical protein